MAGLAEHTDRLAAGARGIAALRLLLATLAIAVTIVLQATGQAAAPGGARILGWHPVYSAAIVSCFIEVAYLILLRLARTARGTATVVTAGLVLDIAVGSALIYMTGGYESAFLPLLFVWIIAAGSVLSARAAYAAASLTVVFFSVGALLRYWGFQPYGGVDLPVAGRQLSRAAAFHLAQSGAFFAVAYLTGALVRHLVAAKLVAEQILAAIHDGLLVLDQDGHVAFANGEASRLLGAQLSAGSEVSGLLDGERFQTVRQLLASRRAFGPEVITVQSPGGSESILALSGSPVRSSRDSFRGLVAVISDRSAERHLEEAKRLAEGRRTVAEVAMSIAHEIRNPLAAVRSAVQEISREKALSPTGRELAEVVVAESDRLERIVADFLSFARPRPPTRKLTDLRSLVDDAASLIGLSVPPDKVLQVENAVPERQELDADCEQFRQALLNLGLNSVGAMPNGGVLRFSCRPVLLGEFIAGMSPQRRARQSAALRAQPPVAPGLVLEVTDNGVGMDEETLRRCGEPFFTTRPEGTGLGMAIVERVAADHGGAVNVRSVRGGGTAVEIWLPRRGEVRSDA